MSARNEGKEKPARDGNPCGLSAILNQREEIMDHQTGYGKFVSRKLAIRAKKCDGGTCSQLEWLLRRSEFAGLRFRM